MNYTKIIGWGLIILLWLSLPLFITNYSEDFSYSWLNIKLKISSNTIIEFPSIIQNILSQDVQLGHPCMRPRYSEKGEMVLTEKIPNCTAVFNGSNVKLKPTLVEINSDGFRGGDYSIEKQNNTFRIIALGDSFTFGEGLNLEETFPFLLEGKLNKEINKLHFEVLNLGFEGHSTKEEVIVLQEKGIKYKPDLIILGFLDNDDESLNFGSNTELLELYKNRPDGWEEKINQLRAKNKNLSLVSDSLKELDKLAKDLNFKILIYAFDATPEQEKLLKEFVESHKNFYYKRSSILYHTNKKYYLHEYDKHPSKLANEIYADELLEIITNSFVEYL